MKYSLEVMVLSSINIDDMVEFYTNVFDVDFTSDDLDGQSVYTGSFGGMEFVLVPSTLTQITAPVNPTHFDIYVDDLEEGIRLVEAHGGKTNGQLGEDDTTRAIGIFDPDENFMILKQRK